MKLIAAIGLVAGCAGVPLLAGCGPRFEAADGAEQVVSAGPGLALPIPDADYTGTFASMACVPLVVPDHGAGAIGGVRVTVGIGHPCLSDLVTKVQSARGTVTTLMSRPCLAEPVDGYYAANGCMADLAPSWPITFRDASTNDAEAMAATLGADQTACADDGVCEYHPNHGMGQGLGLTDFNGESPTGTWLVCVGDGAPGDEGTLESAALGVLP